MTELLAGIDQAYTNGYLKGLQDSLKQIELSIEWSINNLVGEECGACSIGSLEQVKDFINNLIVKQESK